jgi:hypothetical protein
MACTLAESPSHPVHRKLRQVRGSAAASIATGWSEPVPGRELHPLKSNAFHGALLQQVCGAGAHFNALELGRWRV